MDTASALLRVTSRNDRMALRTKRRADHYLMRTRAVRGRRTLIDKDRGRYGLAMKIVRDRLHDALLFELREERRTVQAEVRAIVP